MIITLLLAALMILILVKPALGGYPEKDKLLFMAEKGDAAAQYNLGVMYANGIGASRDDQKAFEWWSRAAGSGFAPAQYSLWIVYSEGRGVARDNPKAISWFEKAALNGLPAAQGNLGKILNQGQMVPRDVVKVLNGLKRLLCRGTSNHNFCWECCISLA